MSGAVALASRLLGVKGEEKAGEYISRRDNCTIRLYYKGRMVHQQHVHLVIDRWDDVLHFGRKQPVVMHGFHGKADDATISLINVPYEADVPIEFVEIAKGNTLTLEGNSQGFLTLTKGDS